MGWMPGTRSCLALCILLLGVCVGHAAPITITIDTTGLSGGGDVIFDFLDGTTPPSNSVFIYDFSTDGTLGVNNTTGDVSGSLPGTPASPLTLADTTFFNEYQQAITFGTFIRFTFDTTGVAVVDANDSPDGFSASLVTTDDPGLLLFLYNVGDADPLEISSDSVSVAANGAPEPGVAALVFLALLMLGLTRSDKLRPP